MCKSKTSTCKTKATLQSHSFKRGRNPRSMFWCWLWVWVRWAQLSAPPHLSHTQVGAVRLLQHITSLCVTEPSSVGTPTNTETEDRERLEWSCKIFQNVTPNHDILLKTFQFPAFTGVWGTIHREKWQSHHCGDGSKCKHTSINNRCVLLGAWVTLCLSYLSSR